MSAYTDFLDKYTKGDKGKLKGSEARDFLNSGGTTQQLEKFIGKMEADNNFSVGSGAYSALENFNQTDGSGGSSGGSSGGGYSYDPNTQIDMGGGVYMSQAVFDAEQDLLMEKQRGITGVNIAAEQGRASAIVAGLYAEANKFAASAQLTGTKYAADRNLDIAQYQSDALERTNKYVVDVQTASNEAIQGLKNQGALDLQAVINSGMLDVEDLRGKYASERVELQGEYDVERAHIQSDFEKFKAARAKEGQMYGSLFAGFWN